MTPEQLKEYQESGTGEPLIHFSRLDVWHGTLTTGYEVNSGGNIHVYAMADQIHLLVYDQGRILRHAHGKALPAADLRPSKRAYPHTTDASFAYEMRSVGEPLTFLGNFDWDKDWVREEMAAEPFKAPTHLDF